MHLPVQDAGDALPAGDVLPAAHASHASLPTALLNLPTAQGAQNACPSVPLKPALHLHSEAAAAPGPDMEFTLQWRQGPFPEMFLNCPAAHGAQLPEPSVKVYPAVFRIQKES